MPVEAPRIYTVDEFPSISEIWLHPNPQLVFDPASVITSINVPRIVPSRSAFGIWGPDRGDGAKGRWVYELAHLHHLTGIGGVSERPSGGAGAGHTIKPEESVKMIYRMLPSTPDDDWIQVAGRGELVRLDLVEREMEMMREYGYDVSPGKIMIDGAAFLAWDAHVERDKAEEIRRGIDAVGTTKSGVGPAAGDYTARMGMKVGDLLLPKEKLLEKVLDEVDRQNRILATYGSEKSYSPEDVFQQFLDWAEKFGPYIQNTHPVVMGALRDGRLIEEGAQGFEISLDTGSKGAVTSTDSGPGAFARRHRISAARIGFNWGATKLVPTCVGRHIIHAPLPESFQEMLYTKTAERGDPEAGAVSGRRRNYIWHSIPALRAAVETYGLNGLLLAKIDVCDELPEVHLGMEYVFPDGTVSQEYDPDNPWMLDPRTYMNTLKLDGWGANIAGITSFADAPGNLQAIVHTISELVGVPIVAIGTGPNFGEAIYADNSPFAILKQKV